MAYATNPVDGIRTRSGSKGRSTALDQPNLCNHVVSGVKQRRQGVFTLTKPFLCRDCAPETRALVARRRS